MRARAASSISGSGSMPTAQLHYPFENNETFAEHFPADREP
jgi:isoleucyl-tRNA synthetase